MRRVRAGKARSRESGYIVTWDVDSLDKTTSNRLFYFVFGHTVRSNGQTYRYPGFVERDGVRYLGQSVVFVGPHQIGELTRFLGRNRVDHDCVAATLG